MVTEREAEDSKRLLDQFTKEYETEFRQDRLRLARRRRTKRPIINWTELVSVLHWILLVVTVGVLAVALDGYDVADFVGWVTALFESGRFE